MTPSARSPASPEHFPGSLFGRTALDVISGVGLLLGIREGWAFEVVGLCQRRVLEAHTRDADLFLTVFERLASELPAPESDAERFFLTVRLREVVHGATLYWYAFVCRPGALPADAAGAAWFTGPLPDDPRAMLREWLRQLVSGPTAAHDLAGPTSQTTDLQARRASAGHTDLAPRPDQ